VRTSSSTMTGHAWLTRIHADVIYPTSTSARAEPSNSVVASTTQVGRSSASVHLDTGAVTARLGQSPVTGDQGCAEGLRERDERRVVCREVVSKFPDPVGHRPERVTGDRQLGKVGTCLSRPVAAHDARSHEASKGVEHLDVDQVWGVEVGVSGDPSEQRLTGRPADQDIEQSRGVQDDQRSRPARTASTITSRLAPVVRLPALASTSTTGGRSATRTISASR